MTDQTEKLTRKNVAELTNPQSIFLLYAYTEYLKNSGYMNECNTPVFDLFNEISEQRKKDSSIIGKIKITIEW